MTAEPRVPGAPGAGIRVARRVLVGVGVVGLLVAAWITLTTVHPQQYGGILLWLVAAVVLHDGVLGPLTWLANRVLRGAGRRVPAAVLAIVQVAAVVGSVVALVVLPEIRAKRLGVRNPTVLPMDYALHLLLVEAALVLLEIGRAHV